MFTKKDLRNGDVCYRRNGTRCVYVCDRGCGIFFDIDAHELFEPLKNDLTSRTQPESSIDKVYRLRRSLNEYDIFNEYDLVFDRERDCSVLDKEEREYLSAVIKPFMDKVDYIVKVTEKEPYTQPVQYIRIRLKDNDIMTFPNLRNDTMYKGMEVDKRYTLSDLDL